MRGPANMGPARRVAEGPFLIVTGKEELAMKFRKVLEIL